MSSPQSVKRWAAVSVMSLLVGCGSEQLDDEQDSVRQEIVGGSNTTIEVNPWQVSLQSSNGSHFCGGSVLNENWILTAQHCVNSGGYISKPGRILAGSTNRSGTGQVRTVAEVVPYPGYSDPSMGRDIALLRLSTPLDLSGPGVKAIPLVTSEDASAGATNAGVVARATGWGTTRSNGGSMPRTLQTVDVKLVSNSQADASYSPENINITADQLAAAAPGKDSCQGDSGGPLTVLKGNTRVLAGVVSWGYGCADSRFPGMYARVSSYASWISSKIGGASTSPPPPTSSTTLLSASDLSGATDTWKDAVITIPAGTIRLSVNLSGGTGDADLYVRKGSEPTSTAWDCRPYLSGNTETCTFDAPAAGTWYVSIKAYRSYSGVSITATIQ